MPGAFTTLSVKDALGTTRTMRVWDESGTGVGPYSFGQVLVDGSGSAALAKAEDAVAASGDSGIMAFAVRRDTAASSSATDGDIVTLNTDSTGKLWVNSSGATQPVSIATAPVLVAGSAIVGKVGIDQTTPGTTNLVAAGQNGTWTVQPGNTANTTAWKVDGSAVTQPVSNTPLTNFGAGEYETVAASQSAQVIGPTGGAGDYLSHVVVSPVTTSPGVVTILDNATAVVSFAGGASSLSNLVPFIIPVGIISSSGAWKITTGANVSCVAVGNFT